MNVYTWYMHHKASCFLKLISFTTNNGANWDLTYSIRVNVYMGKIINPSMKLILDSMVALDIFKRDLTIQNNIWFLFYSIGSSSNYIYRLFCMIINMFNLVLPIIKLRILCFIMTETDWSLKIKNMLKPKNIIETIIT